MYQMISLDSPRGDDFGFISDHYGPGSYLWEDGKEIWVSFIESRARGNFRRLVETIRSKGFTVVVPTPLPRMEQIVRKNGYVHSVVRSEGETIDVWKLPP